MMSLLMKSLSLIIILFLAGCIKEHVFTSLEDIQPDSRGILIVSRTLPVKANFTIPATVIVKLLPGGRFVIAPDVTLTINGLITAPSNQWVFEYQSETSQLIAPQLATVYPHWFGAKGDGLQNDSAALRHTAGFINHRNGGTISFLPGTYIVGKQTLAGAEGKGCAYCPEALLKLENNTNPVTVLGNGAILKAADGLHFGAFNPVTGEPLETITTVYSYAGQAYWGMIELRKNKQVTVQDFELDGNIANLDLGGLWGDTGRQLAAYGIYALSNDNVIISNIYTHHHGSDGISIGHPDFKVTDPAKPHTLNNIRSEYNARQGLTWNGGRGLRVNNCSLSHSGRARFHSAPAAGLDIEAEDKSIIRDGLFENCQFINNVGAGMVADTGDSADVIFRNSLFWGTTNYSIWPNKPGLLFEDCTVHGTVVRAYPATSPDQGTIFRRCHFEDIVSGAYSVYTSPAGLLELGANYLLIEDSTLVANNTRGIYLDGIYSNETLRNVTIGHRYDGLVTGDYQSLLRGVTLEHVDFTEAFSESETRNWYISVELETCQDVTVSGPRVRWKSPDNGPTGQIC